MTLYQRLEEYISAAFTGIWITSHEQADALAEIGRLCQDRQWRLASWDIDRGLIGHSVDAAATGGVANAAIAAGPAMAGDPVAALRSLSALASPESSALLVLPNFHRLLQSAEIIQVLAHQIQQGKHLRCFFIVLAPLVQIPIELEKHFVILEHDLPDRQQLLEIATSIATQEGELPQDLQLERLLDAAAGLTRLEAEGAFSLSLVREHRLLPQSIWELKEGMLKKSGLLQLYRGRQCFADLGGLGALKDFCTRALSPRSGPRSAKARGVMLLSPPGCGKSAFAKALGQELSRPTLILEVGALMGSLVGQSEERTRQALRLVDAMSPCILFIDEVDKALAGVSTGGGSGGGGGGGGGGGDSGVLARIFGCLLFWLSDHESDVFVICTANDISKLPPEFGRAERFDALFFLDTPSTAEKAQIWPIHLGRYGLAADQQRPADSQWTGAEIQSCCRLAALLDLSISEAARHVVPVAVSAAQAVEQLRSWASGRCLDASRPGIYRRDAAMASDAAAAATATGAAGRRRISRPSSN